MAQASRPDARRELVSRLLPAKTSRMNGRPVSMISWPSRRKDQVVEEVSEIFAGFFFTSAVFAGILFSVVIWPLMSDVMASAMESCRRSGREVGDCARGRFGGGGADDVGGGEGNGKDSDGHAEGESEEVDFEQGVHANSEDVGRVRDLRGPGAKFDISF